MKMSVLSINPLHAALVLVNVVALGIYGMDKSRSMKGGARIPESTLLTIALFAPFGAYLGMIIFRHKTRKPRFLMVPVFFIIHVFLIMCLLYFHTI